MPAAWGKWRGMAALEAARETPRERTGRRLAAPAPTPAASGPRRPAHPVRGAQGLGFSALFSARPSTLIKARQAG